MGPFNECVASTGPSHSFDRMRMRHRYDESTKLLTEAEEAAAAAQRKADGRAKSGIKRFGTCVNGFASFICSTTHVSVDIFCCGRID